MKRKIKKLERAATWFATHHLDNWRFWMTMMGFGLGAVIIVIFLLFSRQNREEQQRQIRQKADDASKVEACYLGVRNAPIVLGFVNSHRALIESQILSVVAAIQVTGKTDPLYKVRVQTLHRLNIALNNAIALQNLSRSTIPTKTRCDKLAQSYGLPVQTTIKGI